MTDLGDVEILPVNPLPGTVGVAIFAEADDTSIAGTTIEYLTSSGVPASRIQPLAKGSGGIGAVIGWVVEEVLNAGKKAVRLVYESHRERQYREYVLSHLPSVTVSLEDARVERANAIGLLEVTKNLAEKLQDTYPNRQYDFTIQSSMPALPFVMIKSSSNELSETAVLAAAKLIRKYEGRDRLWLFVQKDRLGRTIVDSYPFPLDEKVDRFEPIVPQIR